MNTLQMTGSGALPWSKGTLLAHVPRQTMVDCAAPRTTRPRLPLIFDIITRLARVVTSDGLTPAEAEPSKQNPKE